ncbi:MAG: 3'(2'),5'-bisphosphate nucleotidase CysQ [Anaerolineae bacterium]|nr:3'(2'),5'-bisphosphate nucleotidase CysQ [Anaerolineae bacterium]
MDQLFEETIAATRAAGRAIMQFYQSDFTVADKSPDNPVTDVDLAADRLLHERLLALLPDAGWLSEETADNPERLAQRRVWVVDPLDGTKEFVMGIPEFSVAVALVDDGQPLLAVVYNPATGELFSARRGAGLTHNGCAAAVSGCNVLAGARVDASRSEMKRGEFEPFASLVDLNVVGSIAYKLARVAAGQADATWSRGPKHEWDICAGTLLVQEGGGICVDLDGQPMRFNKSFPKVNGLVADNGALHEELMATLMPHGAARVDPPRQAREP